MLMAPLLRRPATDVRGLRDGDAVLSRRTVDRRLGVFVSRLLPASAAETDQKTIDC